MSCSLSLPNYSVLDYQQDSPMHYKLLAIVAEDDQKAPFLVATTPMSREGRYSFPWIAPLYP